jgi:hypothetical protein
MSTIGMPSSLGFSFTAATTSTPVTNLERLLAIGRFDHVVALVHAARLDLDLVLTAQVVTASELVDDELAHRARPECGIGQLDHAVDEAVLLVLAVALVGEQERRALGDLPLPGAPIST